MIEVEPQENLPDEIDRAAAITAKENETAIDKARWAARPEQVQNEDGSWPVTECDCGAPLGLRLAMGKIRCIDCQTRLEQRNRLYVR